MGFSRPNNQEIIGLFKKLYSGLWPDDCEPFTCLGEEVDVARIPDDLKETNSALIIWGGADISPEYYRHPLHKTTHPGGMRDKLEWTLMNAAKDRGISIIGVCRGAQMACALAGGWLIQDVRGHSGRHLVQTKNDAFETNSIHHQMMAGLENVEHELVAWREGRSGAPYGYMDNKIYEPPKSFKEPEFVFFPKIRAYAIQWHPEMMHRQSAATKFVLEYIREKESDLTGFATKTVQLEGKDAIQAD